MLWYPSQSNKLLRRKRRKENVGCSTYRANKGFVMPPKFKDAFPTRLKRQNATPKWINSAHQRDMSRIYKYAIALTKKTGIEYQVDHIEPLTCDNSCGLHVPWNLRVVTKLENLKKKNNRSDCYVSPWCVFPTPI